MIKRLYIITFFILNVMCFSAANAALDLELTKGVASALPIAVVPFANSADASTDVSAIISNDLNNSGEFNVLASSNLPSPHVAAEVVAKPFLAQNTNDVVVGSVIKKAFGKYQVTYSLVDLYARNDKSDGVLLTQEYTVTSDELRALAHHISDQIYQQLTGVRGIFSTKIAYVLVENNPGRPTQYKLEVADIDGYNSQSILTSTQPIMSPSWSPDGAKIAYVSFESFLPQIFISEVATGKRKLLTSFTGINGAPSWTPDGSKLALALSKGSVNPNIFVYDLNTGKERQITSDWAINTEPAWAPDGKSVIYTSDRGGNPQIYQVNLQSKMIQRVTYAGNYNSTASYSPDGTSIVLLHRESTTFNVAIMDLKTGNIKDLTNGGDNQSPSVAPNGKMVVFASEHGGQGVLGIVSTNGNINLRIPDQNGSVHAPAWSPFIG